MNELDACKLWVHRDFSMIPTNLLVKAYGENRFDDIEIIAPSFETFKEEYRTENCGNDGDECEWCNDEDCYFAYEEYVPKIPMWGYIFVPDDPIDQRWFKLNADQVAELGFIIYETDEIGIYLGIDGAGYDFYEHHWLPLYRLRGLKWHEEG